MPQQQTPPEGADALPPVLAQAWGLARSGQRGPKPELSVESIVDAAVRIADAEGLDAVTMARVARDLGFTTMSLYRHVASKDDLIQLMNDAPVDIPVPSQAESAAHTWRETLAAWTRAVRRHYVAHPWKLEIPVSGIPTMPNTVRLADWALRGMRDLPLTDAERISLLLTLNALADAFARMDVQLHRAAQQRGAEQVLGIGLDRALAQVITAEKFPDMHRLISAGAYFGSTPEDLAQLSGEAAGGQGTSPTMVEFEYALTLVLDGLEARVRSWPGQPRSPGPGSARSSSP